MAPWCIVSVTAFVGTAFCGGACLLSGGGSGPLVVSGFVTVGVGTVVDALGSEVGTAAAG